MAYEDIVSPVAEFFGFTPEAALEGRKGPRATKATLTDRLLGISSGELKGEQKLQTGYKNDEKYRSQVQSLNGKYVDGQSEGTSLEQIHRLRTARTNDDYANSAAGKAAAFAQTQQTQQFAESSKRADNQFAITNKRLDTQTEQARLDRVDARKDRLQDRIDGRESRADDLMFRRETMERADRKDEKSRRRESIQALVAGLSSLGAAFAV